MVRGLRPVACGPGSFLQPTAREPQIATQPRRVLQPPHGRTAGVLDLPPTALRHVLLTAAPIPDLLRHLAVCAAVHPDWRWIAMESDGWGSGFAGRQLSATMVSVARELSAWEWRAMALRAIRDASASAVSECDLYMKRIGDEGAKVFVAAVHARSTGRFGRHPAWDWSGAVGDRYMYTLTLSGNELTDAGLYSITTVLPLARGLRRLDLRHNPGIGAGLVALAAALPRTLRQLDLHNTGCDNAGIAALASALSGTAVVTLDVSNNPSVGVDGWTALGAALPRLRHLNILDCSHSSGMQGAGAAGLAAGLPTASTGLACLYLNACDIADEGAAALASALVSRQGQPAPAGVDLLSVMSIELRRNGISVAVMDHLRSHGQSRTMIEFGSQFQEDLGELIT